MKVSFIYFQIHLTSPFLKRLWISTSPVLPALLKSRGAELSELQWGDYSEMHDLQNDSSQIRLKIFSNFLKQI